MFNTIEIRWFGKGAPHKALLAWFVTLSGPPDNQPARRDYYLRLADNDALSVKLREGGLEIKVRQKRYGLVALNPSAQGFPEAWTKWRFPLDHSYNPTHSILGNGSSWITVEKERVLKHYQIGHAGEVQPMPAPLETIIGCHLELASILSDNIEWWTVAYEATDQGEDTLPRLLAVAEKHLEVGAPDNFTGPNSFGYPQWLATRQPSL